MSKNNLPFTLKKTTMIKRCAWAAASSIQMQEYHDNEWGVPVHDDRSLFELLILEGAQAGLSWSTVLAKRENYKKAFNNFDVKKIIKYDQAKIEKLLLNPGIIRNKLKINSVIINAKAFIEVQKEFGSFSTYIWSFVDGKPIISKWKANEKLPAKTLISDTMSAALKKRGFKFIGSTICYAFMQATGIVNDHTIDCFKYPKQGKTTGK
jgi:DNA-3-methyladenine glycosylase I